MNIWSVLGIDPTDDLSEIKRAYARKLKTARPDQDPQGYQRLREAFEGVKQALFTADIYGSATDSENSQDVVCVEAVKPENTSQLSKQNIPSQVDEIVTLLLTDTAAGFQRLYTFVSGGLLENIATHEMFSHLLAEALCKREGVTYPLLKNVAAMLGWEINNVRPVGISDTQLQAIYAQIENTDAQLYWDSLADQSVATKQERERFELLSVEGIKLPFRARLIPEFVGQLYQTVEEISAHHPVLLPRINSQLLRDLSGRCFMLDWRTTFFMAFWGMVIAIGIRHDTHPLRDTVIIVAVLLICTMCKSEIQSRFSQSPVFVAIYEALLSLLILGVFAKIFSGLYSQLHFMSDDPARGPTLFGMLIAFALFCIWAICPHYWRWYNLISNSLIAFLTFPWRQAKKPGWLWRIAVCGAMLYLYSWLVAWAVA
ncbi:MAG: hypothetical protein ACOH2G_15525 [Ewingella sp.]